MKTLGGSASEPGLGFIEDPDTGLWHPGANRAALATAGTSRWEVDASGMFIPVTDDAYDIGDSTHRVRRLYLAAHTFTPALTAQTVNPTLGTGSSVEGYYIQLDRLVIGYAAIRFGTAGTAAGTGNYRVSLPVAVDSTLYDTAGSAVIGTATSVTAGNGRQGVLRIQTVGGTVANIQDPGADGSATVNYTQWSNTHPGAWTTNDRIYYQFFYRAASA